MIGNQVRGWGEGGEGLKNLFYSLAGMRFAIRYRGPFGALLALLVLDRHLRVVHAVWIFYGRHCCNVPLMFPVL